jgi:hypothetical protein
VYGVLFIPIISESYPPCFHMHCGVVPKCRIAFMFSLGLDAHCGTGDVHDVAHSSEDFCLLFYI